ncbi:MAG: hypothetical protein JWR38_5487 [Mucilaginibacter sp.]|nr:hypothetical protein [Mucilaginibacter sp.]
MLYRATFNDRPAYVEIASYLAMTRGEGSYPFVQKSLLQ